MSLRILYSSNAFWAASGYGVQGGSLLPRLANLPEIGGRENIAMFAWYGLQGGMHEVNGFRVYPCGTDPYGNDVIGAHARDFNANIVISLIDVWVMHETAKKIAPALWLPWLPIDHNPVPQKVLDSLTGAHLPLTYSRSGRDLLAAAGVVNEYIPHGLEPTIYKVLPDVDKVRAFRRDVLGNPSHLTVMVAANKGLPDRKAFQVQVRAWANFAKDKPGAKLYIHSEPTTMYGGIDFAALLANLGIADKVIFPDRYQYFRGLPADYLALIYNNADAYLGASMSEGFGIPLIEAQACGVPVITTDYLSMPELVRWGYAIPPRDLFWTAMNSWWAWPDVDLIQDALENLYTKWHENGDIWPLSLRLKVQDQIHGEYSWDAIARDQWQPLMSRLAGDVPGGQKMEVPSGKVQTQGKRLQEISPELMTVNGREKVLA